MSEIYEKIMTIFQDTLQMEGAEEIRPDATFEELDIDSLDLLEVVTAIERHFDIEFSDEALNEIKTAGDAVAYVEKLVNEG